RLRPDRRAVNPTFLYYALGSAQTEGTIRNRAKGSTMPNLSAAVMKSVPVVIPTGVLQQQYAKFADSTLEQIEVLQQGIDAAIRARDLLLPRLMNSEIPV